MREFLHQVPKIGNTDEFPSHLYAGNFAFKKMDLLKAVEYSEKPRFEKKMKMFYTLLS